MSKITYADKVALNTNTEIPAQNKVEDTDMNNIKGAVNEIGKYNTATAGTNGDFYVTLKGTLSSGDIVRISFPAATNPASNARLSIDGGTTYANIRNKVLWQLRGAGVENLQGVFVFDGTNWIVEQIEDIVLTVNIAPNSQITLSSVFGKTEVWAYYNGAYNERCMMVYNGLLSNNLVWLMTNTANGTDLKKFGLVVDFSTGLVRNDVLSSVNITKLIIRQ